MSELLRIGTMTVVGLSRVYPLDPESGIPAMAAVVPADSDHPIYLVDKKIFQIMLTGQINSGGFSKVDDGIFIGKPWDELSGIDVRFPMKPMGERQFRRLLDEEISQSGPNQRLRFTWAAGIVVETIGDGVQVEDGDPTPDGGADA